MFLPNGRCSFRATWEAIFPGPTTPRVWPRGLCVMSNKRTFALTNSFGSPVRAAFSERLVRRKVASILLLASTVWQGYSMRAMSEVASVAPFPPLQYQIPVHISAVEKNSSIEDLFLRVPPHQPSHTLLPHR